MAESDVMKIMIDLYGAKAAEQSIWLKLGSYAFFVFFTLATLSFIVAYATRKQPTNYETTRIQKTNPRRNK